MFNSKKKLFLVVVIILILFAIPLTIFLSQQEQDTRQKAAASTTLYFNPSTSTSNPLQKTITDTFTVDVMVTPGDNKVSTIRYEILFDSTKLSFDGNNPVVINTQAFPAVLEGPILGSGRAAGSVSIGSNYNLALTAPTKVATIHLKAIGVTGNEVTSLTYTTKAQVLSVGSTEQAAENVLASATPLYIRISGQPTPTPTPTPLPPTLSLNASPTSIPYNSTSIIAWSSTNASSCSASDAWSGNKNTSGSQSTQTLTESKTYTLTCVGPGGSVTKSVTVQVGSAPTPTPTTVPQATIFSLTVYLHGLGNSGDNANPTAHSLSNKNPLRQTREVEVSVYNADESLVSTKQGKINYNPTNGNFTGQIDMGTNLLSGIYTIKLKSPFYLNKRISGIQTIKAGETNTLPQVTLVTGDVNNDNVLNILDYNLIAGCYSDFAPPVSCTSSQKIETDITDDGNVNQFDYNLFLRDLSVQNGD